MTLREYLVSLATNAETLAAFQANPDQAMQKAGLNPEERELVKSRDEGRIKAYVAGREGADTPVMVIILTPPTKQ
jgi:hypothetical protein